MLRFFITLIISLPLFALEKVSIQFQWYDQFQFAGYYMAKEKGFYKEAGLDVSLKKFNKTIKVVDQVTKGKANFGVGRSSLILEKANGADIVALAAIFQASPMTLLSLKENDINNISDYRKYSIMATNDIVNSAEFKIMVLNEAIKIKDINFIASSGRIEDLINKKADFMLAYLSNEPYLLKEKGIKYNVINPKDGGINFYSDILFTSEEQIINHPKRVKAFLKATLKGWEYAFNNIDESVNIIYKKYNSQNKSKGALYFEAKELKKLAYYNTNSIGTINIEKFQNIYNIYKVLGQIKEEFDLKEMLYSMYNFDLTAKEKKFLSKLKYIRVSNESNWPPYNYNEYGIAKGYSIDYMNLIAQELGLEIKYINGFTWNEFLTKIRNKEIDIMLNIVKTQDRSNYINFTKDYARTSPSIFIHNETKDINSLEDLNGKVVSVPKGFYYEEHIRKRYPKIILKTTKDSLESIQEVQYKRADATLVNFSVANYLLKYHAIGNIKAISSIKDESFSSKLSLGVRDDMPMLLTILNKAMQDLDDTKVLQLRQKWLDSKSFIGKKDISFTKEERSYIKKLNGLNICIDIQWEPYEYIKDDKHSGLTSGYMDYISKVINVPFNLIPTSSFKQSLSFVKDRQCDILPSASITIERLNYLNFTKPYLNIPMVIAIQTRDSYIHDIDKLQNKYFGTIHGDAIEDILKKKYPNIKVKSYSSLKEGLIAVQKGEIYGFIDTSLAISNSFSKYQLYDLKIGGELKDGYDVGIAIRNDEPLLLSIFQKVLSSMSQAEKDELHKKWLFINYETVIDYTRLFSVVIPIVLFFISIIFYLWNIKLKKEIQENTYLQMRLQDSISDFKLVLNSTMEAIFILNSSGKVIQANDAAKELFKLKEHSDFIGKHILDFISKEDKKNVLDKVRQNKTMPNEINFQRTDGTSFLGLAKGENIVASYQSIRVVSIVDLTELKEKEHLLYQQSKMALMGEMMSAIAHQWRQPLNAISALNMQVEVLIDTQGKVTNKEYHDISQNINNQLIYMSKTIDDFRDFFIPSKEKVNFCICHVIHEVYDILKPQFSINNIKLDIKCNDTYIYGYANEFKQVLINLINNSKDAIQINKIKNGKVNVKVFSYDNRTKITISDNGGGIKPSILSKIFAPYFTTKFSSKGTGIGLYMSKMIIEKSMKGELKVRSYKNNTVFIIILYNVAKPQ